MPRPSTASDLRSARRHAARLGLIGLSGLLASVIAVTAGLNRPALGAEVVVDPLAGGHDFNALVETGTALTSLEMEGPLATGGDLTIDGAYNVALHSPGTFTVDGDAQPSALVVGGAVDWADSSGGGFVRVLNNGYAKIGDLDGTFVRNTDGNGAQVNTRIAGTDDYEDLPRIELTTRQPIASVGPASVLDFDAMFAEFRSRAEILAGCANTVTMRDPAGDPIAAGTVAQGRQVHIRLEDDRTNVLHLTGDDLNNMADLVFDNQPTATSPIVIVVDTDAAFTWDVKTQAGVSGTQAPYMLWLFNDATSLDIAGGDTVEGTVYAPRADLTDTSPSNVEGTIVARSATLGTIGDNGGEVHYFPFAAELRCDSITPDGNPTKTPASSGPTPTTGTPDTPGNGTTSGEPGDHLAATGTGTAVQVLLGLGLAGAGTAICLAVSRRRSRG